MEAISRSCLPEAAARTKRQRKATCCGVLGAASHRTTCSRSSAAKLTSGLILAMRTHISYWPQYVYLFMIHTTSVKPARPKSELRIRSRYSCEPGKKAFNISLKGSRTPLLLANANASPMTSSNPARKKFPASFNAGGQRGIFSQENHAGGVDRKSTRLNSSH